MGGSSRGGSTGRAIRPRSGGRNASGSKSGGEFLSSNSPLGGTGGWMDGENRSMSEAGSDSDMDGSSSQATRHGVDGDARQSFDVDPLLDECHPEYRMRCDAVRVHGEERSQSSGYSRLHFLLFDSVSNLFEVLFSHICTTISIPQDDEVCFSSLLFHSAPPPPFFLVLFFPCLFYCYCIFVNFF